MACTEEAMADLSKHNYLFTTFATAKFLPILQLWLRTTCMQGDAIPKGQVTIRVYLGHDISEPVKKSLEDSFNGVVFMHIPKEVPEGGFADYWLPEHYAWKLWLYHTLAHDNTIKDGTIVTYFDSGAMMVKLPLDMFDNTVRNGICFIEDCSQKNGQWTSEACRAAMGTTDEEMAANQILGGLITFMKGSTSATALLDEAYAYSLKRDVITGPKWGPGAHRHDQAILSVLRLRYNSPTVLLDNTVCHKSLRDTRNGGQSFYLHRGQFKVVDPVLPGITDSFVVNLDRRSDRYEEFKKNIGSFGSSVKRLSAADGRSITMTPELARLFKGNDFMWKKGVVGCALSHLRLWYDLATSPAEIESYLVFEDDAKPRHQWLENLKTAMSSVPADYDILYLGGVLPPNKAGLQMVKEPVSQGPAASGLGLQGPWNRVAFNQVFGQPVPTRYYHFCTYAYIISRRGAQKIMKIINDRDSYYTSADHMIVNNWDKLNIYFSDPLLVDCTQDDDPAYANSQFNNYNRVDTFDSDIWNQTDAFSDISLPNSPLNISAALHAVYPEVPVASIIAPVVAPISNETLEVYMLNAKPDVTIMEQDWLQEILGRPIKITKMPETSAELKTGQLIWITCSRADLHIWTHIFKAFENEKRPFKALHLSDEFGKDDISWYMSPMCKGVIRNYYRPECARMNHVVQIPLGYADGLPLRDSSVDGRDYIWSFEGTKWFNREEKIQGLKTITPNYVRFYDQWLDPGQSSRKEYYARLKKSQFVPIIRGNHFETFRLYEVLESGAIPLVLRDAGDEVYWKWLTDHIPLVNTATAEDAKKLISYLMMNPGQRELYREGIIKKYNEWKTKCMHSCRAII